MKIVGTTNSSQKDNLLVTLKVTEQELHSLVAWLDADNLETNSQPYAEARTMLLTTLGLTGELSSKIDDVFLFREAVLCIQRLQRWVDAVPKDKTAVWTSVQVEDLVSLHLIKPGLVTQTTAVDIAMQIVVDYERWLSLSIDYAMWEASAWAAQQFKGETTISKAWHLVEESLELVKDLLADSPGAITEMADIGILLGGIVQMSRVDLAEAMRLKIAHNKLQQYGPPDAHGVVHHIRNTTATGPNDEHS